MSDQRAINWRAETLRVTLFRHGGDDALGAVWQNIVGRAPEVDENRARDRIRREQGPYGSGLLEVVTNPIRIDIRILPLPQESPGIMLLGDTAETEIRSIGALIEPWLADITATVALTRIAFAGVLIFPVEDLLSSYRELARLLPTVQIDAEHTRDLLYRVNRVKDGAYGFTYNRMTTWSSLILKRFMMNPSLGMPASFVNDYFIRFEFDNNTPAEHAEPLNPADIVPIFSDLVGMALENSVRGDRP
jgi:hypothetical protein